MDVKLKISFESTLEYCKKIMFKLQGYPTHYIHELVCTATKGRMLVWIGQPLHLGKLVF